MVNISGRMSSRDAWTRTPMFVGARTGGRTGARRGARLRTVGAAAVLAAGAVTAFPAPEADAQGTGIDDGAAKAVVLMYHRFGDGRLPSTNIRLDQFKAHIAELKSGKYNVVPLMDIVTAIKEGGPLPDRTVAITVDDAYASLYTNGWPLLREAGLPFTLFVATDAVDRGSKDFMSWEQLRELRAAGVTIGSQTASHPHLPRLDRAEIRAEFEKSNARFESELGFRPVLQAYPYGEASSVAMAVAREMGFVASFGQHSGTVSTAANIDYLPRFALNENFGGIDRFRLVANALPLYATDVSPANPTLGPNPPPFGFTVGKAVPRLERLACYSSAHGKLTVERLGERRIEVRPPTAFPSGRARINCTLPAGEGRWRWFGYQFYVPPA